MRLYNIHSKTTRDRALKPRPICLSANQREKGQVLFLRLPPLLKTEEQQQMGCDEDSNSPNSSCPRNTARRPRPVMVAVGQR